jgi:hypothetical protein
VTVKQASVTTSPLDYEIRQEQAAALGRAGRAVQSALHLLEDFDRHHPDRTALSVDERSRRAALVDHAGQSLWAFIVQREACGFRRNEVVFRDLRVPPEVRNRMGISSQRGG